MGSAGIQGDLWGQAPADWAALQEPLHAPLWEAMLSAAGVGAGTALLDAGCGAGGLSASAASRGAKVSGLDAAAGLIEQAGRRVPGGEFRVGDLEELPYADGSFDAALAANSVQYAADPAAAIAELKRVTRPGGRVVVGIWGEAERCEFRFALAAIAGAMPQPPNGEGPFALSVPGALEALMAKGGLAADVRKEVACPFEYADLATAWRATAAAGPIQGAIRAVGAVEPIERAFTDAMAPFVRVGGRVRVDNTMLCVAATA